MGLDTVRFRGRLARVHDLDCFDRIGSRRTNSGHVEVSALVGLDPETTLHVRLARCPPEAWIERSLPRLVYGHNVVPLAVENAAEVIASIWNRATRFVEWSDGVPELTLLRVDLARDLRFEDPFAVQRLLAGLQDIARPYRPGNDSWGDLAGLTTLRVGKPRRWLNRLYLKEAEVLHRGGARSGNGPLLAEEARLAVGLLRNELTLRSPVLKEVGMRTVRDLDSDRVQALHRHYFDRAGFSHEVGAVDKLRATAVLAGGEDYHALPMVLGLLHFQVLGLPMPWSPNTVVKYQRVARRLGLSAADIQSGQTDSVKIDYDAGRVMTGDPGATVSPRRHTGVEEV